MPVSVKICGINSAEAAEAVLRMGADFGGLVFFEKSPRHLGLEAGRTLAERMRGRLKLVALVVDADNDRLSRIAEEVRPDFFQLHGRETPARAAEIRTRFQISLIKALPAGEPSDLGRARDYEMAEMLLFDAPVAEDASRPGGHGMAFDWQMLKGASIGKPWFLAGGLNPQNVGRAIETSGARMVDVSSGVESAPGVKSGALISDFIAAARTRAAVA
ncbi:MAG TPA: phosphoribosylanthranilate isomerase [Rhizomicrobium sp.]|nr:phosphoribosylanthranilate isomerase [Rhizomicrobium sp.]